jgi:hypothetical protein
MGLKIFSEQFRDEVLKLNLKTPPDIVSGLVNMQHILMLLVKMLLSKLTKRLLS